MEEDLNFVQRLRNCFRIHWNGFFYLLSPLVLLPLLFMQPLMENRALYILLLAFLWYAVDVLPQGVTAVLPIIWYPLFGIMSSMEVCMSYAQDSQMVFILSNYLAISIVHNKLDRYIALRFLKKFGVNPTRILPTLMILTFLLSIFIPDACACSLMIPLAKAILQILDEINVCKPIDNSILLKDDETPYPSKVANAFYIGIGYAANIGGMTTFWSSESGYEFQNVYNDTNAEANLFLKYIITALPVTICLLIFTIVYLEIIFLDLMWSKSERRITYDDEASVASLDVILNDNKQEKSAYVVVTLCLMVAFVILLIIVKILDQLGKENKHLYIKYSTFLMLICLIAFVCPVDFSFLNYFICQKPPVYKTSPSILPWSTIPKQMPWGHFLVYGSGLAFGVGINKAKVYKYLAEHLVESKSLVEKQLGFMGVGLLLSTMGANHLITKSMISLGIKASSLNNTDSSLFTIPITLACSLSFLLPVSSISNCFSSGWGNLRSRDIMLAGIGPTIVGFVLIFSFMFLGNVMTNLFETKL
ncbi:protein I'm not dead yet-like [Stomoxys calcitrans]|uniref:protein I'm not dead yet-like n=1 Tax=Stomoxys calcitrans TaxID=35570 RepID=UPI0027E24796|nr:protein I'm not dead yet-like [Stomoxys calcitrans]